MRSATGQKARVRAKCVWAKVVGCGVRACGQKSVTPNTLGFIIIFLRVILTTGRMSAADNFCQVQPIGDKGIGQITE